MILGTRFEMNVPADTATIDAALEHVRPLFAADAELWVERLEYDYVGDYSQPERAPIGARVVGLATVRRPDDGL